MLLPACGTRPAAERRLLTGCCQQQRGTKRACRIATLAVCHPGYRGPLQQRSGSRADAPAAQREKIVAAVDPARARTT